MILLFIIFQFLIAKQKKYIQIAIELSMQRYYFFFLFFQLFIIVSISSNVITILNELTQNFKSIATLVTSNLSKINNYFFFYILLQDLFVNATTLLQLNRIFI